MANPVYIDFVVRGIPNALKALKSVSDAVTRTEQQSTAVVRAESAKRGKAVDAEAKAAAKAAGQTASMLQAAQRAGTKTVEQELKVRLSNQIRHANALQDAQTKDLKARLANQTRHLLAEHKTAEAARKKREVAAAASQQREAQNAQNWFNAQIRAQDQAEKTKQRIRDKAGRFNAQEAAREANKQLSVAQRVALEEKKLHLQARLGEKSAKPGLSAQARLMVLNQAKGKSPEEQEAALAKVRLMGEEARLHNKHAKKLAADEKRVRDAATSEFEADQKKRQALRDRIASDNGKFAAKQAKEEAEARKRFGETVQGHGGKAIRNATIIAGATAAGLARTVTGLGGGFSVQDSLQERVSLERQASLLSVAARTPDHPERVDPRHIVNKLKSASIATGTDAGELGRGLNAYVAKTGNYKAGESSLEFFGKAAKLTGSNVEDVMRTFGTMTVQNKALGKDALGPEALKKLALSTIMQARQGSVEFEDMARAGGLITRSAGQYTGDQTENQRKLLGLSQIGMRVQGNDVAAAATSLANVQSDATKHKEGIKALLGRDFTDEQGRIKGGTDDFLIDLMDKSGGNLSKLQMEGGDGKTMFGKQAMKTFQALALSYNPEHDAALAKGATKEQAHAAGMAALRKDVSTTISGKYDEKDLERDFAEVMKSSAEQFEGAVRQLKMEVADKLIPTLIPLVDVLRKLTPTIVSVLDSFARIAAWAANNPLAGIGVALSLAIGKEVAAAGLNKALERAMATSLGSAAGLSVASAVVTVTAATLLINKVTEDEADRNRRQVGADIEAANAHYLTRPGAIQTAEDKAKAQHAVGSLQKSISETESKKGGGALGYGLALAGAGVADFFTLGQAGATKEVYQERQAREAKDQKTAEEQKKTLQEFTDAIKAATANLKAPGAGSTPGAGAPPGPANPADKSRGLPIIRR